jgi:UDP-GlcNAc:undecaprenyl-phosphate GlcNAc-1-phosphate transferase
VNEAALTDKHLSATTAVVAAAFIGIVVDTLRVFLGRVGRGRSPFSPDRTHLHHWFLRNLHTPKAAVRSMLLAQALTVVLSLLLVDVVGLTLLIVVQVVVQWLLITSLRTRWCFRRSYRMVRGIERMSA